MKRRLIRTLITGTVVSSLIVAPVYAAPQDEVKSLESQKSQAEAQAASVNQDLVDLLVEYEALQQDMKNQEKKIDQAGKDLEDAEEKEKQQYEDMKLRIKYMYENGEGSFISVLVSATDFTDFVNKAEYVQKVNKYDRDMLERAIENGRTDSRILHRLEISHFGLHNVKAMLAANDLSQVSRIYLQHVSAANGDKRTFEREIRAFTGIPVTVF